MTVATAEPATMPLTAHLREARSRLVYSVAAFAVAAVVAFLLSEHVMDTLRAPVLELADSRNAAINYDSITGAFDLKLRIALFGGIALSSPVWLIHACAYLAPALKRREKRTVFGFVIAVVPLFVAGCTVGVLVFPRMVEMLTAFAPAQDSTLLQASTYFDFVLKLVLASGVAFTLPVFIVALNFMGVLAASTIARSWRGCVLGISVFSALVTPAADVLSMVLIAAPLTVLCVAAWMVAWWHDRRAARSADGEPPSPPPTSSPRHPEPVSEGTS